MPTKLELLVNTYEEKEHFLSKLSSSRGIVPMSSKLSLILRILNNAGLLTEGSESGLNGQRAQVWKETSAIFEFCSKLRSCEVKFTHRLDKFNLRLFASRKLTDSETVELTKKLEEEWKQRHLSLIKNQDGKIKFTVIDENCEDQIQRLSEDEEFQSALTKTAKQYYAKHQKYITFYNMSDAISIIKDYITAECAEMMTWENADYLLYRDQLNPALDYVYHVYIKAINTKLLEHLTYKFVSAKKQSCQISRIHEQGPMFHGTKNSEQLLDYLFFVFYSLKVIEDGAQQMLFLETFIKNIDVPSIEGELQLSASVEQFISRMRLQKGETHNVAPVSEEKNEAYLLTGEELCVGANSGYPQSFFSSKSTNGSQPLVHPPGPKPDMPGH